MLQYVEDDTVNQFHEVLSGTLAKKVFETTTLTTKKNKTTREGSLLC